MDTSVTHILALDSSSSVLSFCLTTYQEGEVYNFYELNLQNHPSQHEIHAPVLFQRILRAAMISADELSSLVLGIGPGSFTGLRIGMSMVKACMAAYALPARGISLLEAISHQTPWPGLLLSVVASSKHRFFYQFSRNQEDISEIGENDPEKILAHRMQLRNDHETLLLTGPSAPIFPLTDGCLLDPGYHLSAQKLLLENQAGGGIVLGPQSAPHYGASARTNKKGVEQKIRYTSQD